MGTQCGDEPSAARGPTASYSDRRQGALPETEGGDYGKGDRQHPALAANLVAEFGATRADSDVPAQRASSQRSGACGRELLADLRARSLPGTTILDQGRAGLEHERLHLLRLTLEDLGDLGMVEGAKLRKDERGLLSLW